MLLAAYLAGLAAAGAADVANYQQLRSFSGTPTDGEYFYDGVIEASDGRLYGTTYFGGMNEGGTIYMVRKDGTGFEFIHRFLPNGGDGFNPNAALLRASDGALYGTTFIGPVGYSGSIFRIRPVGLAGEAVGGAFHVQLEGFVSHIYAVDRTVSFPATWTEMGRVTNTTGRVTLTDSQAGAAFYRARVLNP